MEILNGRQVFFLGVNTGYVTKGLPDERYVDFYRSRASSHLHCAIIGNIVVPGGHGSNRSTPMLTRDRVWGAIAAAISSEGSIPGIQLATAWSGYQGMRNFVGDDPEKVISAARDICVTLGRDGVSDILAAFEEGAAIAFDHGFRHIQFHGAHGYLLSLLIDGRINPNATEVLERLTEETSKWVSKGVEVSMRISLRTGSDVFDAVGRDGFHDAIASIPFSYIDLSSGFYNIDKRLIYPSRPEFLSARIAETKAVALRHPGMNFIYSGHAANFINDGFPKNIHLGLCRDMIANPEFLKNFGSQRGCENRSKCHYFSRGAASLTCAMWDNMDRNS